MNKIKYSFIIMLLAFVVPFVAHSDPGDTYVQVDFSVSGSDNDECSILKIAPDGTLSEFVSFDDVIALTGEPDCDFDDVGITVADNGDVYFSEDESGSIILSTPAGALSTFITEADVTAITGGGSVDFDTLWK